MQTKYSGLSTLHVVVGCHPLLQGSNQKIEGKTNPSSWKEENITVEEFGMTDINVTSITSTP